MNIDAQISKLLEPTPDEHREWVRQNRAKQFDINTAPKSPIVSYELRKADERDAELMRRATFDAKHGVSPSTRVLRDLWREPRS